MLKFSSLCISRSSCKISLPQRRLLSVKGSISFGHSMTMMVSLMRDLNTSQQHPLQFLHLLEKELRVNNGGPKCLCWNTNSTTDEFLRDCTPQRPSLLHPQVLPIFPSCHGDALLLFMYLFCCWGFLPYLLALMSGIYLMIVLNHRISGAIPCRLNSVCLQCCLGDRWQLMTQTLLPPNAVSVLSLWEALWFFLSFPKNRLQGNLLSRELQWPLLTLGTLILLLVIFHSILSSQNLNVFAFNY